jgi:uncharacterized protein YjiK
MMFAAIKPKLFMLMLLCSIVAGGCAPTSQNEVFNPLDIVWPYQAIEYLDTKELREPSGLVYHEPRGTFFVIGDEGDIAEFQANGYPIKIGKVKKEDFEGLTYNRSTGLLYAVTERTAEIIEINPEDFSVSREFMIEPVFGERKILDSDKKNRVEGITFAPDDGHPAGGVFYLSNWSLGLEQEANSVVFAVEAPLKSGDSLVAKITGYFELSVPDISDLYYDPLTDQIYAISDETNTFFELTKNGVAVKAYALPGENQEGLTLDHEGFIYLAQDSGGIIKFEPRVIPQG